MNDRLPALSLPQPQQAYSSGTSSPRVGSIGSTSYSNGSSHTSYTAESSAGGPKTPSPSLPPTGGLPSTLSHASQSSYNTSSAAYHYGHDSYTNMNQGPSDMYYSNHMSAGQAPAPQTVTSGSLGHYSHHQQPPPLQPGPGQYSQAHAHYGQYGGYSNGLASPQTGQIPGSLGSQGNVLSLPSLTAAQPLMHSQGYPTQQQGFDTTGQVAPQGMKPRVTATLWEDESALCFQVEAKGICVARRGDTRMINGTKLLNVAGMTRGRRDGILKSEKIRHVVKIGPMHLKGVWIPFDRALDFANKEKITELLYPLFVHNIGDLLYHPTNQPRNHVAMQAAERRKQEQSQMRAAGPGLPNPVQPHHHHSMHGSIGGGMSGSQHSGPSHPGFGRPEMPRAHTFPTPPTSATGVMGSLGPSDGSFWGGQGMNNAHGSNSLAIDTGLSNTRSMPTTPATTPPGASIHNVQQQYQNPQSYDPSRQVYSAPPLHQGSYQQSIGAQSGIGSRYSQTNSYIKTEMGPPSGRSLGSGADTDHLDNKATNGLVQHSQNNDQSSHHANDEEADHENDADYAPDGSAYEASRGPYNYAPGPPVGSIGTDQGQISPELNGSPSQQAGSGRATPRTAATSQGYYSHHQGGYDTPPRAQPPSSNLYSVMSSERGTANGSAGNEMYHSQPELVNPLSNGYSSQQTIASGTPGGKRGRDDDDEDQRPPSREPGAEFEGLKRRRTIHEDSAPIINYDPSLNRARAATMQRRR